MPLAHQPTAAWAPRSDMRRRVVDVEIGPMAIEIAEQSFKAYVFFIAAKCIEHGNYLNVFSTPKRASVLSASWAVGLPRRLRHDGKAILATATPDDEQDPQGDARSWWPDEDDWDRLLAKANDAYETRPQPRRLVFDDAPRGLVDVVDGLVVHFLFVKHNAVVVDASAAALLTTDAVQDRFVVALKEQIEVMFQPKDGSTNDVVRALTTRGVQNVALSLDANAKRARWRREATREAGQGMLRPVFLEQRSPAIQPSSSSLHALPELFLKL